jgi:hypothetical protein
MSAELDRIRETALARIDRHDRNVRLAFLGGALVEGALLAGFLALADLSQPLHLLLLIATVGTYTIVLLGLAALSAHLGRGLQRILQAIALLADEGRGR